MKGAQPVDGVGGFDQAVEGEVELMAVGHGDERQADGGGLVALEQQVAQGVEVALALGHLAAVDEQEAHVHPVAGKGLVGHALALRDLVFVVREHQVFAAGVQVEALAQVLHGHGGALDVPAGTAAADGGIPGGFAGLGGLPEGEVAGRVLLVLVDVDAGAVFHAGQVLLAQLAVLGKGGEAEVPGAVLGLVGGAGGGQLLDQLDHCGDVLGGAGNLLRAFDAQGVEIFEERLLEVRRVFADGDAGGRRVADDLVVHVGDVHDVADGDAGELEEAAQDVDLQKGAEVADVAVVVDGGPAGVHAERLAVGGDEFVQLSREGIEKAESHRSYGLLTDRIRPVYAFPIVAAGLEAKWMPIASAEGVGDIPRGLKCVRENQAFECPGESPKAS